MVLNLWWPQSLRCCCDSCPRLRSEQGTPWGCQMPIFFAQFLPCSQGIPLCCYREAFPKPRPLWPCSLKQSHTSAKEGVQVPCMEWRHHYVSTYFAITLPGPQGRTSLSSVLHKLGLLSLLQSPCFHVVQIATECLELSAAIKYSWTVSNVMRHIGKHDHRLIILLGNQFENIHRHFCRNIHITRMAAIKKGDKRMGKHLWWLHFPGSALPDSALQQQKMYWKRTKMFGW